MIVLTEQIEVPASYEKLEAWTANFKERHWTWDTGKYSIMQVGTGDSALTIPFYEKCGFTRSHYIPNFFTDHYDHPIFECGVQLIDMIYLQRHL